MPTSVDKVILVRERIVGKTSNTVLVDQFLLQSPSGPKDLFERPGVEDDPPLLDK